MKKLLTILFLLAYMAGFSATWYVDPSSTGTNAGTLANPWKTLSAINWGSVVAGDQILFKRGQKFQGTLTIGKSGTVSAPITLGAYGTGANPLFWGTGAQITSLFSMFSRSYVVFQDLTISDTTISVSDRTVQSRIQRGFVVDNSQYITIKRCKLDRVGVGVYLTGDNNTVDSCEMGNLRMVRNTNDGPPPGNDDDYGANPLVISSSGNRITNNDFHDCWAISFDYGLDGGAIDIYADRPLIQNNFIAYNTLYDCNGVLEIGGSGGNTVNNTIVAYNKSIWNGSVLYVSNSGTYLTYVNNVQFYNNVFVEHEAYRLSESALFSFKSAPTTASSLVLRNNIIHLYGTIDVCRSQWGSAGALISSNNVFRLGSGSVLNYSAGSRDTTISTGSLIWKSESGSPVSWDYYLRPGSVAIERGIAVSGLSVDKAGVAITGKPEVGVYEYGSTAPPPPAGSTRRIVLKSGYSKFIHKPQD